MSEREDGGASSAFIIHADGTFAADGVGEELGDQPRSTSRLRGAWGRWVCSGCWCEGLRTSFHWEGKDTQLPEEVEEVLRSVRMALHPIFVHRTASEQSSTCASG